jgi:uncharacterized protein HemX
VAKVALILVVSAAIVAVFAIVVWGWQLSSLRKAKVALTGGEEYRGLSEEYRRLADMAVTAQEHTELKLGDLAVQMAQLRGQLESVQRILKDVE